MPPERPRRSSLSRMSQPVWLRSRLVRRAVGKEAAVGAPRPEDRAVGDRDFAEYTRLVECMRRWRDPRRALPVVTNLDQARWERERDTAMRKV